MAKAPRAGRVKTRLCPPCTPEEAAAVAEAALADTLHAVLACGADRRVLALDGPPGPWLPAGFEVVVQRGKGLDERLAAAWNDAGGRGVQIGMDTPQVTAGDLDAALAALEPVHVDAILGPASDGGWWLIGLEVPDPRVFLGLPMSTPHTAAAQRERLRTLGLRTAEVREHRDVDTIDDVAAVARLVSAESRFAAVTAPLLRSTLA